MTAHEAPPIDLATITAALTQATEPLRGHELLVALDVDGTLVDHDGRMSHAMHEQLQRTAQEHHVVVSTGRSLHATLPIVEAAGVRNGYCVCSNGAVTVAIDNGQHRVVRTESFHPGHALAALREVAPSAHYAVEMADGSFYATPGFHDSSFGVEATESSVDELMAMEAVRVVVHVPDLTPEEFSQIVADSGVHGVEYSIGWTAWLDMAAPGISKASALERLRKALGIDAPHTLAIGDGHNDVEMLGWAEVGVAMGQAPDEVKHAADVVTASVFDDGAAMVLRTV